MSLKYFRDYSSISPNQQQSTIDEQDALLSIIRDGLIKPSVPLTDQYLSTSVNHVAVQCSSDNFNQETVHSNRILFGRLSSLSLSSIEITASPSISPPPGHFDCGIQVDLNEGSI